MPFQAPDCETERIASLRGYRILDTPPEACFDRLTRTAAHLFKAPVSIVSLVDENRQFFKSCHGLDLKETSRAVAFCTCTIQTDQVLVVPNALLDDRFSDNPLVTGDPGIRFYAGAPLITSGGFRLGSLCVIDVVPRERPAASELQVLQDLADEVVEQIEYRLTRRNLNAYAEALHRREVEFGEHQTRWSRSETRAALALDAGEMGCWEWDALADHAIWSPRMEQIFGLEAGAYDGSHAFWLRLVHPQDREPMRKRVQQARENELSFLLKYRIVRPDGDVRWVFERGSYHRDPDGRLLGALGVCWDTTDRENWYSELRGREELFRGLSASCPVGIFRADLEGSLTYTNTRFADICEMPQEELLGLGWLKPIHPEDRESLANSWLEANAKGLNHDQESRLLLPDGRVRWVHGRSAVLKDSEGRPIATVGTVDDITERKQSERALREAKADAEAANRAKDLFLANVSHELRTPLNGILGMTDILAQSDLTSEQSECVHTIRSSGEALLSVVNDILDINRIEAGTLRIAVAPFDLRAAVHRAAAFVHKEAAGKGLEFAIEYPATLPEFFVGDASRIQQILVNFLTNAVKFTEQGGVRLSVNMDDSRGQSRQLSLAIRDTGCGLSDEAQTRLFQPFSQVDPSPTRHHGGVGLGLAISRRLAQLMGGQVGVNSVPNRGSTFWLKLDLPLADASSATAAASTAMQETRSSADPNERRALVAEDNAVNRLVVTRMLQKLGWEADLATDGEIALQLATQNRYTLILMDCQMPGEDGYSACSKIRRLEEREGRAHTPIIALTANAMPGDRERCLGAGMDDYLPKPLQIDSLNEMLARWSPAAA